jgi:uncharacterized membrane protein SpoIIM required for sporulation
MREPLFIKKNKDKWEEYDSQPTSDPDVLSERFVHVLDDLAYAQTFYPKGKTVKYLNERAVQFYNEIYKKKRERFSRLFDFWRYDLPLVIRKNHRFLLLSLCIFGAFYFFGFLSAYYESDFLSTILGEGYLEETRNNIEKGDPFGIYGRDGSFNSFIQIGFNNIRLAFTREFLCGIFFGIGGVYGLMQMGMLIGSFHQMFNTFDKGGDVLLVVYIHGVFELFALVLASAAGFRLCNSFIFAGTYTRMESIKRGAIEAMKLMISVFVLLFFAAFLEGYITRLAAAAVADNPGDEPLPMWAVITILISCLSLVVWYFGIYPVRVRRKMNRLEEAAKPGVQLGTITLQTT